MTVVGVVVTVALIIMAIGRLVWVEGSDTRDSYHHWYARHALDVGIVILTVLFVAALLYRFLQIG